MDGYRQRYFMSGTKSFAIFKIFGERALTAVHVNRGNRKAFLQQLDSQVHGDGGFAGAAFFVADNNDVGFFLNRIVHDLILLLITVVRQNEAFVFLLRNYYTGLVRFFQTFAGRVGFIFGKTDNFGAVNDGGACGYWFNVDWFIC